MGIHDRLVAFRRRYPEIDNSTSIGWQPGPGDRPVPVARDFGARTHQMMSRKEEALELRERRLRRDDVQARAAAEHFRCINDRCLVARLWPDQIEELPAYDEKNDCFVCPSCGVERGPTGPRPAVVQVLRLHRVLHDDLGDQRARTIGRKAGQLTADYLLRHRIPQPAQIVLRCSPSRLASRMLASAIASNAWTFVGTGTFSACHGRPTTFTVRNCPICRGQRSAQPYCDFYAATFEQLYARLVDKRARVTEIECSAMGAEACTFEIVW